MSTQNDVETFVDRARIAETLQAYGFCCDHQDREGLLAVFSDDAEATYDGQTWMVGGPTIVDWLLDQLGGLSYGQHMITAPRITVDGDTATAVAYMTSHQVAAAAPDALIRMNGHYACDLRRVDDAWRISRLALSVGWFSNGLAT